MTALILGYIGVPLLIVGVVCWICDVSGNIRARNEFLNTRAAMRDHPHTRPAPQKRIPVDGMRLETELLKKGK